MAIINGYVSLPEGNVLWIYTWKAGCSSQSGTLKTLLDIEMLEFSGLCSTHHQIS